MNTNELLREIRNENSNSDRAIAAYGRHVAHVNKLSIKVGNCTKKRWTPDRIKYSHLIAQTVRFHEVINKRFGLEGFRSAITAHPFN